MVRFGAVRRELGPLAIIAALSVGVLWPVTLGGKAMVPGDLLLVMEPWRHHAREFPEFHRAQNPILDAIQQFYPWRKFAGESLRGGTIPLWNPYQTCGNPFVANDQSAVFYPETWLHTVMPAERALGWATVLHFFTSGALMYWFLRVLGLRRSAAMLGAIAFMFNGFVVGWLSLPSVRSVPAWLPGMLASFELAAQRRHWPWLAVTALGVAMQFLAGSLHISMLVLTVFIAYVVFRAGGELLRGDRRLGWGLALGGVASVLIGAIVAAIQLLPTLEFARMSSRIGGMTYADIIKHATALPYLLTGLMPDLLGSPVDYNHWGADLGRVHREYSETGWYVGVVVLLLAPAAFLRGQRPTAWFWLGVFALGIALAFGTPLYAAFYHLMPAGKALSGIGRCILMSSVALSELAALGLDALLGGRSGERPVNIPRYAAMVAVVLGTVGLLGGAWVWVKSGAVEEAYPGIGSYTAAQIGRFLAFLVVGTGLLSLLPRFRRGAPIGVIALLVVDLYICIARFTPATRPEYLHIQTRTVDIVRREREPFRWLSLGPTPVRRMAANTNMIVGLEDIQGSDSLEIAAYRQLWHAICTEDAGFPQPDPSHPVIDMLGVKYIHSSEELPAIPGFTLVSSGEGWLYRNEEALPRAYLATGCETMLDADAVLVRIVSRTRSPQVAVVTQDAGPGPCWSGGAAALPCDTTYLGPNRAVVRVNRPVGFRWPLVLTDTFYPGWRAYADGVERLVVPANYCFRAVQVERECSQVDFVYGPASFRLGAFASLCGLGFLVSVGAFSLARRGGVAR